MYLKNYPGLLGSIAGARRRRKRTIKRRRRGRGVWDTFKSIGQGALDFIRSPFAKKLISDFGGEKVKKYAGVADEYGKLAGMRRRRKKSGPKRKRRVARR